jgi:hypothetical protein
MDQHEPLARAPREPLTPEAIEARVNVVRDAIDTVRSIRQKVDHDPARIARVLDSQQAKATAFEELAVEMQEKGSHYAASHALSLALPHQRYALLLALTVPELDAFTVEGRARAELEWEADSVQWAVRYHGERESMHWSNPGGKMRHSESRWTNDARYHCILYRSTDDDGNPEWEASFVSMLARLKGQSEPSHSAPHRFYSELDAVAWCEHEMWTLLAERRERVLSGVGR